MGQHLWSILARLRCAGAQVPVGGLTDAELLGRYLVHRDEAAFEALVWRHAAMVLGVCRRTLGTEQDAEDAFQATFLAFARAARTITQRESVGGWLYRVAGRIAAKARARAAKQVIHALPDLVQPGADPADVAAARDLRAAVDEEIRRLPVKERAPIILCYLEGLTNEQAAGRLGCPCGTVADRLARGRRRLRSRMTRRGLAIPAALLTTALASGTGAAYPGVGLVLATIRSSLAFGSSGTAGFALVSNPVTTLTQGVLREMYITRVVSAGVVLLAAMLTLTAASAYFLTATPDSAAVAHAPAAAEPAQATAQTPAAPAEGKLLFYRDGQLTLIAPDGKDEKKVSKNRDRFLPGDSRLSPDGQRVAYLVQVQINDPVPRADRDPRRKVYLRGLDDAEPGIDLGVEAQHLAWAPDGKHLVATDFVHGDDPKDFKFVNWLVDIQTRQKTVLTLPDQQMVIDWSCDGALFLTSEIDLRAKEPMGSMHLVRRDGSGDRKLISAPAVLVGRLSPDSRRVLYLAPDPERKGKKGSINGLGLFVLDIAAAKATRVAGQPLNGTIGGICWSPDGKRIAYSWRREHEAPKRPMATESHLVIADRDGGNTVTIATERTDDPWIIAIGSVDWR
jgi:RNA polymerase sigma factor (sigma-70 family)